MGNEKIKIPENFKSIVHNFFHHIHDFSGGKLMHMHVTVPDRRLWKMSEVARQIRKIHPSARIWFQNLDHGVGVVHGFAYPSKGYDAIVSWLFGPEYLRPYFRPERCDWDILAEEYAKTAPIRKSDRIESEVDRLVEIIEKKAGIPQECKE